MSPWIHLALPRLFPNHSPLAQESSWAGKGWGELSSLMHFGEGKWSWRARRGAPGEGSGAELCVMPACGQGIPSLGERQHNGSSCARLRQRFY